MLETKAKQLETHLFLIVLLLALLIRLFMSVVSVCGNTV